MTKSESNSLRQQLAATAPVGAHLDADVLNGFAEGSLLERERTAVLAHLAGCAECRAVLGHAVEAAPQEGASIQDIAARSRKRVWMPWGAVAAGIVVACGVTIYRVEKKPVYAPTVGQNQMTAPALTPQEIAQLQAPAREPEIAQKKKTAAPLAKRQSTSAPGASASNRAVARAERNVGLENAEAAPADALDAAKPRAKAEQRSRDLSLAEAQPTTTASFSNVVSAGSVAATRVMPVARPHWRLNEQGQPERAFGDGAWQPPLSGGPSKMHVVATVGAEVWTAGEESQVFRSFDEGATWQPVSLPSKNGGEHTVIHIRFDSPLAGTIEAADGTTWQTNDGGSTWR